jgi:hypothetical protein
VKLRVIRAERDLNANRQIRRRRVIVLFQSPAHFARLNSNDGIVTRRVSGIAVEYLSSNCPFLQEFMVPL